ncbi:MAG: XdhC family protein [Gammaproteobacteria bacterium]|nr:XdhC family protein [Gammaproteobacteria bacterium]
MNNAETAHQLESAIAELRANHQPYAVATVVRTAASTSALPSAKALIDADGQMILGWLGGNCAKSSVCKAARDAIARGATRFLTIEPEDKLRDAGVNAGDTLDGVQYARNGCLSRGVIDVFIEPFLPPPQLIVMGQGLIARAVLHHATALDFELQWRVKDAAQVTPLEHLPPTEGLALPPTDERARFVLVATQGGGDLDALRHACQSDAQYVGFLGSRRKFAAIAEKLRAEGIEQAQLERVHSPAGLHIDAITPEEIALSLVVEIIQTRRRLAAAPTDSLRLVNP